MSCLSPNSKRTKVVRKFVLTVSRPELAANREPSSTHQFSRTPPSIYQQMPIFMILGNTNALFLSFDPQEVVQGYLVRSERNSLASVIAASSRRMKLSKAILSSYAREPARNQNRPARPPRLTGQKKLKTKNIARALAHSMQRTRRSQIPRSVSQRRAELAACRSAR